MEILDLCAGTGSITFEFLSRENGHVTAVDQHSLCLRHLLKMAKQFGCEEELTTVKSDVLKFVSNTPQQFDLIFADPPYNFKHYDELVRIIFERQLLTENGVMVLEHGKEINPESITHFQFMRTYGNVHFSFFEYTHEE